MPAGIPLPISACIIAGNEAHRITPTLQSLHGWTSEIIVLLNDTVTDATDKIAESFGAKVFREPWKGYGPQKNSAGKKAGQKWLLNLDADEVVSDELRQEIIAIFQNPGNRPPPAAFSFPRRSFFCGRWIRHGDWYPDRKVRLWQKAAGEWQGDVHERLVLEGPVIALQSNLLHYSNESIDHMLQKGIRYANEFAGSCRRENRRITLIHLVIRPPWRFLRGYVFKLGFLDGWRGFSIAWMTAFYTFLRYFKAFEARQNKP